METKVVQVIERVEQQLEITDSEFLEFTVADAMQDDEGTSNVSELANSINENNSLTLTTSPAVLHAETIQATGVDVSPGESTDSEPTST